MTLGNVGKASADQFAGRRKLVLVPLVMAVEDDSGFMALFARYWSEVAQQVHGLESGLGAVSHLFHEGSVEEGEGALAALEKSNAPALALLRTLSECGAQLHAIEEPEVLLETLDLQRCLMVAQASMTVVQRLYDWYLEARKCRYETMATRIHDALQDDHVGLLIISQDHQVQFPDDIQVFYVAPPSLNALNQWRREHAGPTPVSETEAEPSEEDNGQDAKSATGGGGAADLASQDAGPRRPWAAGPFSVTTAVTKRMGMRSMPRGKGARVLGCPVSTLSESHTT